MIPYGKHCIDDEDIQAVVDVLKNGSLTQGPKVGEFERAAAKYVGTKYAVAVSSGTAALHMAAMAVGIGPGSSLITSAITFVASANAGLYVGADVEFVDVDPNTVNMSLQALKEATEKSGKVKAIIPVHFAGLPCDMPAIQRIANEVGAVIIEDAAHALGASYPDGKKVGCCSHSLMTIFSFHPVKAVAAGEGGMITTNDDDIYHHLLRLRSHGINKDTDLLIHQNQQDDNGIQAQWYYEMQEIGYNYRITDIQCALGLSQFLKLDKYIERRKELVRRYDQAFSECPNCMLAQTHGRDLSAHHIYVLRIDFERLGISKQLFIKLLSEKGIGTQVHYIPVPAQPYYQELGHDPESFNNAMHYYKQAISIPLYYSLTDEEQQYIIDSIKELLA